MSESLIISPIESLNNRKRASVHTCELVLFWSIYLVLASMAFGSTQIPLLGGPISPPHVNVFHGETHFPFALRFSEYISRP